MLATLAPFADELAVVPSISRFPPDTEDAKPFAVAFCVPMATPGLRFICRKSLTPPGARAIDYPLSSRMDENDAILILDNVFVPWENVFMHGNVELANDFAPGSGFNARAAMHGCTRFAVKLDFIVGALAKALDITGAAGFHGVQSRFGEVVAWRNTMWGLSDAMAKSNIPWNGMVQPDARYGAAYRTISQLAFPAIKQIIEASVGSGLIYLPSHADDFKAPEAGPVDPQPPTEQPDDAPVVVAQPTFTG